MPKSEDNGKVISVSIADLRSMRTAMAADETLYWCETCGAWLEHNDPALASTEDFSGCWKSATMDSRYEHLCRSSRGVMLEELRLLEKDDGNQIDAALALARKGG